MTLLSMLPIISLIIIIVILVMLFLIKRLYPQSYIKIYKIILVISIIITFICGLILIAIYYFKPPVTMNNVYNQSSIVGYISDIDDQYYYVKAINDSENTNNIYKVSKLIKLKDSKSNFNIGDYVKVYYEKMNNDNNITIIDNIYAIIKEQK